MVSIAVSALLPVFFICFAAPASVGKLCPEVLAFCVLCAGLLFGARGVLVVLPACWAILAAGWVHEDRLPPSLSGHDLSLTGIVCDVPRHEAGIQRFLFVAGDEAIAAGIPRRLYLSWYAAEPRVRAGEQWRLTVRLKRPRGARNPAGFDFERWAFRRDIGATGYVRQSPLNLRIPDRAGQCALAAWRDRLARELRATIPASRAPEYIVALVVGVRDGLDADDWRMLQRTGTAHLMAISGLHVGLAAGFAFFLAGFAGRLLMRSGLGVSPLLLARCGAVLSALTYSGLAGFSMPTIRALVMTTAFIVLTGLRRPVSTVQSLAVALYVILWVEPFALLSPGFWMSFGAVTVLLMSGFGLHRRVTTAKSGVFVDRLRVRLVQAARAQCCLGIGLMPFTIYFFALLPILAPLVNFVVVPLFALLIIPLLLIGVVILSVDTGFARPVLMCADQMLYRIIESLAWLSDSLPVAIVPAAPGFGALLLLCLISLGLIWPAPLPFRAASVTLLAAVVVCVDSAARLDRPDLRIVVMDVGQGLAVLVQAGDYAALYDTGPRYRTGDAGRSVVIPVLRRFGVTRVDHLIVSHGDSDHAGGAKSILEEFPDTELLSPVPLGIDAEHARRCRAGQTWRSGRVRFRMLHPVAVPGEGSWSENDGSCVLSIRVDGIGVLLPGDIERRAERSLLAKNDLTGMHLVVAPHHGSRTSSTPGFVATVRPRYVVFSAGYGNRWNLPAADVVDRWSSTGACVLSTAHDGALVFELQADGRLLLVRRWRTDAPRLWSETGLVADRCRSRATVN